MLDIICTRKEKTRVILFFEIYKMVLIILKSENSRYTGAPPFFLFFENYKMVLIILKSENCSLLSFFLKIWKFIGVGFRSFTCRREWSNWAFYLAATKGPWCSSTWNAPSTNWSCRPVKAPKCHYSSVMSGPKRRPSSSAPDTWV